MDSRMSNEEIKNSLEFLRKIKKHCGGMSCYDCEFNDREEGCIFFNKPWQWELGGIEDNI